MPSLPLENSSAATGDGARAAVAAPGLGRMDRGAVLERVRELEAPESDGDLRDLSGVSLVDADLSGLDLSGWDFSGADLSRANLENVVALRANFEGAVLFRARARGAEFAGSRFEGANLGEIDARSAGFGSCRLDGATLIEAKLDNATLSSASLRAADLSLSSLVSARALQADFTDAVLTCADLSKSDLADSEFAGAHVDRAVLSGSHVSGIRGYERASWVGIDMHDTDFTGAYLWRRFVLDQNYLHEFQNRGSAHQLIFRFWSLTSDCGRSIVRWGLWTVVIAVFFGAIYPFLSLDYGDHRTWFSPMYFSVVTLTTLGYGDVVPSSLTAQLVVMAEVVTGYVMLGGLLSILSNKMARRAE